MGEVISVKLLKIKKEKQIQEPFRSWLPLSDYGWRLGPRRAAAGASRDGPRVREGIAELRESLGIRGQCRPGPRALHGRPEMNPGFPEQSMDITM